MPTTETRVSLKLVGDETLDGHADLMNFRQVVSGLERCLRVVERIVAGKAGRLRYPVVDLEVASASIVVQPFAMRKDDKTPRAVARLFDTTVKALENGKPVDDRLSLSDLRTFRRLSRPLSRGASRVEVNGRAITLRMSESLDRLEGTTYLQLGAVRGRIEAVDLHQKHKFLLYPAVGGVCIPCRFDESLRERARAALDRQVTVTGKLQFREGRPWPERVNEVSRIDLHETDDSLPKLRDLIGFAPDMTGELSTAEFMRSIRDE